MRNKGTVHHIKCEKACHERDKKHNEICHKKYQYQ